RGGGGDDSLVAGAGNNTLLGGAGDDTIFAANGLADFLDGGPGNNTAYVDPGRLDEYFNIQTVVFG
ncbi:MAG TPA: hypothetical protein VL992_10375, partial [Tepidisphaeraceae bacterium]|nr:hypothetical protein [Tepidisphaeraceae bacterium]